MSAGQGWELAENSLLYWLLVVFRAAHLQGFKDDASVLRSAQRDADFRLRRSNNPHDKKVVEFLRSISTRLMMAGNDQAIARAERAENEKAQGERREGELRMQLAIYQLSDAFAALGAIPCESCGNPAREHLVERLTRHGVDCWVTSVAGGPYDDSRNYFGECSVVPITYPASPTSRYATWSDETLAQFPNRRIRT